jgi:A/G-specific adenine glycosylase
MGIGVTAAERERVSHVLTDEMINRVQPAVVQWGHHARRALPWRASRDPWAILVSETMLQQTQVARVIPKYHAFLHRFPTIVACAAAPVGEVVDAWAGLGYNRRAVFLHRLCVAVVERHDGELPADLDALLALPGIGPYTARAVLTFAHERDVGVIDTNIGRVLARLVGTTLSRAEAQQLADRLVPEGRGWEWNQSLLDLGALLCGPQAAQCGECPVRGACRWRGRGPDPARKSAGVSRGQSRFAGSDREGRGRLVAALRLGSIDGAALATAAGWPDDAARARRVAETLVRDGLAAWSGGRLVLP